MWHCMRVLAHRHWRTAPFESTIMPCSESCRATWHQLSKDSDWYVPAIAGDSESVSEGSKCRCCGGLCLVSGSCRPG